MNFKKKIREATIQEVLIVIALIIAMIFIAVNHAFFSIVIMNIYTVIKPFIYGLFLAFVFNIPMNFFMRKLPNHLSGKTRKLVAALFTLLCMSVFIIALIAIFLPMIIDNIMMLANNYETYLSQAESILSDLSLKLGLSEDLVESMTSAISQFSSQIVDMLKSTLPALINVVGGIVSSIKNVVFAVLIAVYLVISKETLLNQCERVAKALFNEKHYSRTKEILHLVFQTFSSFITGQGIEAVIIGVLCYIGCQILGFEYAAIVSVIIGITNIIPIFGAILGVGLGAVIIAFVNPIQGLVFLVFGVILQQFESNLIYSHVVGSSVGLPALWVLFAVTIGGGLFGVAGLVFGLPVFSVIYELFKQFIISKEKSKVKND